MMPAGYSNNRCYIRIMWYSTVSSTILLYYPITTKVVYHVLVLDMLTRGIQRADLAPFLSLSLSLSFLSFSFLFFSLLVLLLVLLLIERLLSIDILLLLLLILLLTIIVSRVVPMTAALVPVLPTIVLVAPCRAGLVLVLARVKVMG